MNTANNQSGLIPTLTGKPGQSLLSLEMDEVLPAFRSQHLLLLRGFQGALDDFESLTGRLGAEAFIHHSRRRDKAGKDGATTTVTYGADYFPLHRERAHLPGWPTVLFFACKVPAAEGGETTVCDGVELFKRLSDGTKNFLSSNRFRHQLRLEPRHWQRGFGDESTSVQEARRKIEELRSRLLPNEEFSTEVEGDVIVTNYVYPCVSKSSRGSKGQDAFVSELPMYMHYIAFFEKLERYFQGESIHLDGNGWITMEDGSPVPRERYLELSEVGKALETGVEWQSGDILMVSNERYMHGRHGFKGEREVFVRMAYLSNE